MPRNFEATFDAANSKLKLRMFGIVGEDFTGDGTYVDATSVAQAVDNHKPKEIDLAISSRGGSVFHGLAIYEILKNSGAKVTGTIFGLCGSIMSAIACAADELKMNSAALMMIHEASGAVLGRSSDMRMTADITDKMNDAQAEIFAARTGKTDAEVRAMLTAETWFTAKEALAMKLITSISPAKTVAAEFSESQFSNVPASILPILAALQKGPEEMATLETPLADLAVIAKEDKPTPPVAPQDVATAVVKAMAEATAAEAKRQTTIKALCDQAKRPDLAVALCADTSITVADSQSKLFAELCKKNGPLGDEGGTAGDIKEVVKPDGNEKYRAEFKAEPRYGKSMDEAGYVAMRRVDDGLDELKIGTAAKATKAA